LERVPTSTNAAAALKTINRCLLISWKTFFPFGSELARGVSGASFPCAARTIDGPAADPAVVWALERLSQRRFIAPMHELLMTTFYRTVQA
jgi:hypothetical protein